jgi:chorismate mutase
VSELSKRLRLNPTAQLLIALSIFESSKEEQVPESLKLLKQKLIEYHNYGKPEPLPDYAVHRIVSTFQLYQDSVSL